MTSSNLGQFWTPHLPIVTPFITKASLILSSQNPWPLKVNSYLKNNKSCLAVRLLPLLGCRAVELGAAQCGQTKRHPIDVDHVFLILLQAKDSKKSKAKFKSVIILTINITNCVCCLSKGTHTIFSFILPALNRVVSITGHNYEHALLRSAFLLQGLWNAIFKPGNRDRWSK